MSDFHSLKILVASENPPKTYLSALNLVGLDFECSLRPPHIENYDGLLLIGGGDVLPAYYGGDVPFRNADFVRDKLEFDLVSRFVGNNLPILAICRGFQLVNVFFGGALACVRGHAGDGDIYHAVSGKGDVFGDFKEVNSAHRQAVRNIPPDASVLLTAEDGVIEGAIFNENILCVQFHPERMSDFAIFKIYGEFKNLAVRADNRRKAHIRND